MTVTIISFTQTTAAIMDGSDQLFLLGRINGSGLAAGITATGSTNDIYIEGSLINGNGRGILMEGSTGNITVAETGRIVQQSTFGDSAIFLNSGSGVHNVMNYGQIIGNYGIATGGSSNSNNIFNYGSITSTEGTSGIGGVTLFTDFNDVTNAGTISGVTAGLVMRTGADFNSIANSGTISGMSGIIDSGIGLDLVNSGDIIGLAVGMSSSGSDLQLVNTGRISGETGLSISGANAQIVNHGEISGGVGTGISQSGSDNVIENYGTIVGNFNSFSGTGTTVINEGFIDGDMQFLSIGDDTYIARGDGRVSGSIAGSTGEDTLIGGAHDDLIFGGAQNDIIKGRAGDDNLQGDGGNDQINGQQGDDTIDGNAGKDVIRGGRGDDDISGGNSNDVIFGGRDDDLMFGGAGVDTFVMTRVTDNDVIGDFTNGTDLLDVSRLDVVNLTQINAAGALFSNGNGGSVFDLGLIGGDGLLEVETMAVGDWNGTDFIF